MNIYYSFNDFMAQVMEKANEISLQRHGLRLEVLFSVSYTTFRAVRAIINEGWKIFLAVVVVLAGGPFGFLVVLTAFLTTPIGLIVLAIFGAATIATMKKMYDEKILPNTVRDVGEKYKTRWEDADNNPYIIDNLLNEATNDLYQKAYQRALTMNILN